MMGYRSTGAMWFSQQALDAITKEQNALIQRDIENGSFTFVHAGNEPDNYGIIDGVLLEFEQWKWYESYPDIAMYESMFKLLDFTNIPYDFVRIGEEAGDIEQRTGDKFVVSTDYEVI